MIFKAKKYITKKKHQFNLLVFLLYYTYINYLVISKKTLQFSVDFFLEMLKYKHINNLK